MFLPARGKCCRANPLWRSESLWKLTVAATSLCSGGVSKRLVCLVHSVSGLGSLPFNPSLAGKREGGWEGLEERGRHHRAEQSLAVFSLSFSLSFFPSLFFPRPISSCLILFCWVFSSTDANPSGKFSA